MYIPSVENTIAEHYHHIDNGGVTFTVKETKHDNGPDGLLCTYAIEIDSQYFGYPSLSSRIDIGLHVGLIQALIDTLLEAQKAINGKQNT